MIPLWIRLYVIQSLKEADVEVKEFKKFKFDTKIFNLYNLHGLGMDHYVRIYYSWIHGACHWPEENHGDIFILPRGSMNQSTW